MLRRVRRKRFDRIIVLGDLVGYGADPNPIVDRVRKLKKMTIIRGNHDKVCSSVENGEMFNKVALVPWIFDYYTKLGFSPAHKIHKIHALRRVSASSALSSLF